MTRLTTTPWLGTEAVAALRKGDAAGGFFIRPHLDEGDAASVVEATWANSQPTPSPGELRRL
jgi:hypothetical protein